MQEAPTLHGTEDSDAVQQRHNVHHKLNCEKGSVTSSPSGQHAVGVSNASAWRLHGQQRPYHVCMSPSF